jgi:DnaJ-class molecular chaperone
MDYYATLGLKRGASAEEIKKAYRSLAMKHHPDRGGDEKKFKEISQAYDFLTDPEKKKIIDLGGDPNGGPQSGFDGGSPFEFHFGSGNFEDVLRGFGFGGFNQRQQPRRNKSVSVSVQVTLEEVLTGKDFNAEIAVPGGKRKTINISIPPGVETGQQVRYRGMGDDSITGVPPGDLLVNVFVQEHPTFVRNQDSIICERSVPVWDALLGTEISILSLDGKKFNVGIPAGTQPGTVLSCKGEGLPRVHSNHRGDLLIRIKVEIPKNLTESQKTLINKIKNNDI